MTMRSSEAIVARALELLAHAVKRRRLVHILACRWIEHTLRRVCVVLAVHGEQLAPLSVRASINTRTQTYACARARTQMLRVDIADMRHGHGAGARPASTQAPGEVVGTNNAAPANPPIMLRAVLEYLRVVVRLRIAHVQDAPAVLRL